MKRSFTPVLTRAPLCEGTIGENQTGVVRWSWHF